MITVTPFLAAAADAKLEDWGPLDEATGEVMHTSGTTIWCGQGDEETGVGVARAVRWKLENNEFVHILSGRMTVTPDGGEPADIGLVTPPCSPSAGLAPGRSTRLSASSTSCSRRRSCGGPGVPGRFPALSAAVRPQPGPSAGAAIRRPGRCRDLGRAGGLQSGLAYGGNKTRKLEYLVPDALAQGADTLVSIGGVQSNHTRQVAAVGGQARPEGHAGAGELG